MSAAELIPQREIQTLYSSHHGWLYGWLCGKLGNTFDAADLAHDTFLRVMVFRRSSAHLGDEPRALLTHIAKGLVVDHWRRRDVERAYLEAVAYLPDPESPSPETRLLILEALYRIEAALRSLPDRTQEIFLLAQMDGFTYREIAERFDLSLGTVKRHMRKAFVAYLSLV